MNIKKRILIAPLNWGLGHASRCIPIINALIEQGFEPIIASDGDALGLLKKEFPKLICLELPSYQIKYSKYGFLVKWQLLKTIPTVLKSVKEEKKVVEYIIKTHDIKGIISDNRFGIYTSHMHIPSVYITHQLQVFSGITSWITIKLHQKIIKKYTECWIPDFENNQNLCGKLGHTNNHKLNLKYLGPLSRFNKTEPTTSKYTILVLLSGPEPQRSLLENKILRELKNYKESILVVKGVIEHTQKITHQNNMTIYNFMQSLELENAIKQSDIVISRSGYTTIMDLAVLFKKKVLFIPTPGQNEQLYLAKRMQALQIAPYCKQSDFTFDGLKKINGYKGFEVAENNLNFSQLFSLFKGE
ncbi:glycosyltransferase [Yeosuana marina]|uniref:glycosyltransferase n=1 Tax=Yeosuana marina TaxID=1565536 RepID=UPI0030C8CC54